MAVVAGVSILAAVSLSLVPPSPEILEQQRKEREMSQRTAEIKKLLEEEVAQTLDREGGISVEEELSSLLEAL